MINQIPDYLHRLISYSKKLSGLVGVVDFDLLQVENQNIKSNFEPICKPLESAPFIWMSKLGGITIGCFSRWKQVGDVITDSKGGFRMLAYTGNLLFRKNELLKILAGDETLIQDLNEIFSLVLWDQNKNEMMLATDRYGNLPIYYQYANNRLFFGSEVKTILLISRHSASLNREALEELLWFGSPLTEQTLFQGIEKIPPSTRFRFTCAGIKKEEYWSPKFLSLCVGDRTTLLDKVEQSFRRAIKKACEPSLNSAIALSGGMDTRAMLAEVVSLGLTLNGFTMGVANAADLKAARHLGRYVSGKHHQLIFDSDFLKDFEKYANELVWLTEGSILLQDAHLVFSSRWCSERFNTLIDGGWGEVSRRGPLRRISRGLKADDDLCEMLMYKWGNNQLLCMFYNTAELKLITARIRQTLETLLSKTKQDTIGDTIDNFFLRAVWPNRIGPQVALQSNYLQGKLPFLDYEFMNLCLQIPCSWREMSLFHFFVVTKRAPELKQFGRVFCDLPIPWTDNYYIRYMIPALNLILHRFGIPSFDRPNFPYRIWWRRELKEQVTSALNAFAQRGILNQEGFSEILKAENINSKNYDIAASRLCMLELWCKNFLDTKEIFG